MKVSTLLVLSLYIYCVQTKSDKKTNKTCQHLCAINYRPVCAYNAKCNYEERNICLMHKYNCKRVERKMPALNDLRPGRCPQDNKCKPEESVNPTRKWLDY